jgi:hypothetical protein
MTTENAVQKTTRKKRVLVDSHVEIDLYVADWHYYQGGAEAVAKARESAAKEFMAFVRDHRHQDVTGIDVVREYREECEACGAEWEPCAATAGDPLEHQGRQFCAGCGAMIDAD